MGAFLILWNLFFSACSSQSDRGEVDRLNDISYSFHYRNIDSTRLYAEKALALSGGYSCGRAEAFNNLAYIYSADELFGSQETVGQHCFVF